jgi:hypothetical protein
VHKSESKDALTFCERLGRQGFGKHHHQAVRFAAPGVALDRSDSHG